VEPTTEEAEPSTDSAPSMTGLALGGMPITNPADPKPSDATPAEASPAVGAGPAVGALAVGAPAVGARTFTPRGAFVPPGAATTTKKKSGPSPVLLIAGIVAIVVIGVGAFLLLQGSDSSGTEDAAASPFEDIAPPTDLDPVDLTKIAGDGFIAVLPSVPLKELQPAAGPGDKAVTTWVARAGSNDLLVLRVVTMPPDSLANMPQLMKTASNDAVTALGDDFFAQTVTQFRGVPAIQMIGRSQDQWIHKVVFAKGTSIHTLTATSTNKEIPASFADVLTSMRFATDPDPADDSATRAESDETVPEITVD
jgi:hypothetical protein